MSTLGTIRMAFDLLGAERRRRFLVVAFLGLVVSLLEAVSALLVLVLLTLVLEPGRIPDLPIVGDPTRLFPASAYDGMVTAFAVVFGFFFIVRAGFFLFQRYALSRVVENSAVLLADRLFDGYLSMPYEFHLRRNSSELVRNAYDNVQQVTESVFRPLAELFAESVLVLVMLAVLFVASPLATVGATAIVGATVLVTLLLVQPRLRRLGRARQVAAQGALQHLQQGLGGLRDIKVLGREKEFSSSFRRARTDMAVSQYGKAAMAYVPRVTIETTFFVVVLVALVVATRQGAVGSTLSVLGLFAYAGVRVQPSLQKIAGGLNSLRYAESAVADLRRDLDLLDVSRSVRSQADTDGSPLQFDSEIRFENVTFRYAGAEGAALQGVNLAIPRGTSVGIAGPTGGGKTTLLDLLCGLLAPTEGRITVDGVDVASMTRRWQRNIGVVHQTSFLIDDTLRRNIALGVPDDRLDEDAVERAAEIAQLSRVVDELPGGLDAIVGERGVRLSGGQRQRVTLARAIYRRPALLILDEGTSALDNATETAVMEGLRTMRGDVTVVMVAHRLSTIAECDLIIHVENGRVAGIGRFDELCRVSPSFRAMSG